MPVSTSLRRNPNLSATQPDCAASALRPPYHVARRPPRPIRPLPLQSTALTFCCPRRSWETLVAPGSGDRPWGPHPGTVITFSYWNSARSIATQQPFNCACAALVAAPPRPPRPFPSCFRSELSRFPSILSPHLWLTS